MNTIPHLFSPPTPTVSRRDFLRRGGSGAGWLALAALMNEQGLLAPGTNAGSTPPNPLLPRQPHFAARARSVIWLFMNGGQSQVDTWDYKPELEKRDGKELEGFDKNTGFFTAAVGPLMKSPFKFAQHGRSGTWASEIFPNMVRHVDDMAFIHSCFTRPRSRLQPQRRSVCCVGVSHCGRH